MQQRWHLTRNNNVAKMYAVKFNPQSSRSKCILTATGEGHISKDCVWRRESKERNTVLPTGIYMYIPNWKNLAYFQCAWYINF